MLDPSYLAGCADDMAALFAQLETEITCDIARRVAKAGNPTVTALWQQIKLREAREAYEMCQRLLKSAQPDIDAEIRSAIVRGAKQALKFDDAIYREAGLDPVSVESSVALMEVIVAGVQKTNGVMSNLTMTTARDASQSIQNALDRAYMQVVSGAFSFDHAQRSVINELGRKGYTCYKYDSGTRTSLEAASRRALITGLNQTTAELQLARASEMGSDLVEVTDHVGARPSHQEWQGQVYSISGNNPDYDSFYDATGYGTGDGLCGWNCYHSFYPYYEGVSGRTFVGDFGDTHGKTQTEIYEESQVQRYYERQVRTSRRQCAVLNAAMEDASEDLRAELEKEFSKAAVLLKRRQRVLHDYCAQTGREYDPSRVVTFRFNRSTSSRATWANIKANR